MADVKVNFIGEADSLLNITDALSFAMGGILKDAFDAAVGAVGDFVSSALEAEQGQARLAQIIKSTGGAAGLTQDAANDLAQQFMNLAGGSDDAILAIEEMGLRMGTISAEEMPNFIQMSLDLGAVMGDNTTAARLLAQAQEDPVSVMGRLRRAGILFTEEQEKQTKALVEAGDIAGATAIVMGRLAEATGGAAAANAETMAGKWEVLKGRLGEAGESIGTALLPPLTLLFDSVITPALPLIEEFATVLAAAIESLTGGNLQEAFDALGESEIFNTLWHSLGFTGEQLYNLGGAIAAAGASFQGLLPTVQPIIDAAQELAAAFQSSMPMIQATVADMAAFVMGQINTLSPTLIANVSGMLSELTAFWKAHGAEIMAVVDIAFRVITVTVGGALVIVSGIIKAVLQGINGDWSGAWETMLGTLGTFFDMALSLVGINLDEFIASWQGTLSLAKQIVSTVFGDIITNLSGLIGQFVIIGGAIIDGIKSGIEGAVAGLVGAAVGAALSAFNAAKSALGIHSPSALFADIGRNMMLGMAGGISQNAYQPAMAMAGASYQTINATINVSGAGSPMAVGQSVMDLLNQQARTADNRRRTGSY